MSSGEWVDKVMVNKQDHINGLDWDPNNVNISDVYQKYLADSSKFYPEKQFGLFPGTNQFDDLDDLEPDSMWQFNHSKHGSFTNGVSPNVQKPNPKQSKSPEFR